MVAYIDIDRYVKVFNAIKNGCNTPYQIRERFGNNGVYIARQLKIKGYLERLSNGNGYRVVKMFDKSLY